MCKHSNFWDHWLWHKLETKLNAGLVKRSLKKNQTKKWTSSFLKIFPATQQRKQGPWPKFEREKKINQLNYFRSLISPSHTLPRDGTIFSKLKKN